VDFRPILFINGILLIVLAFSMIFPMLADFYFGYDDWKIFFISIIITLFSGGTLILSNSGYSFKFSIRDVFVLTNSTWIIISIFGALPFWLSSLNLSFTNALFESVSGITTTGASVINGINHAPAGILLWRALLQWLGGFGIIAMSLSLLPYLKLGGMQIFKTEFSEDKKSIPKINKIITEIAIIYSIITIFCSLSYMAFGMEVFDALAHALTTVSTGGFSTYENSFAHYNSFGIELVAIIFMILGALPFILYLRFFRGNIQTLLHDSQVQWFLGIILLAASALSVFHIYHGENIFYAVRTSLFHVVSVITGTSFKTEDYSAWGGFSYCVFIFIMVIGGCAGSTSSGIKVFRIQILQSIITVQTKRLLHVNGVFLPNYNKKPVPRDVPASVMSFLFLYAISFVVLSLLLSLTGLDFITSITGAISALSNSGIGLGDTIGPHTNFGGIPDTAKWILIFGMILGRLEIMTFFVMIVPQFWKK